MAGFELSEWIAASPEAVFNIMTDPAMASTVMENIVKSEKMTDGPMGAGTILRETRVVNGKESETELHVEKFVPSSSYQVSATVEGIKVVYTYSLNAEREGTAIHMHADVSSNGLKKLMVPIVSGIMKREDGDHLQQLKAAVERSVG